MSPLPDAELCYRALSSRDRRFDGRFYAAVTSTGIYCRPSCPARTPARRNVVFHLNAASAQAAGFRACKRCLPDATPGSPEWDVNADLAGRAMRLINDGLVDREGVSGLAQRLGYSERHLNRLLTAELGAGPLALARARRAMTARSLIEATFLPFSHVAYAAGFSSLRQFNDTVREVYATTPTSLRSPSREPQPPGIVSLRLGVRTPYAGATLWRFLSTRAVPGVEAAGEGWYARSLRLPRGPAALRVHLTDLDAGSSGVIRADFALSDPRDLAPAVERTRRLLDADADPVAVREVLGVDPVLGSVARVHPGLRVPGHVDGAEVAVRAILGQQVSVAGARTLATRLVDALGEPVTLPWGLTRLFPTSAQLAEVDSGLLAMPQARKRALTSLSAALASGEVVLDRSADRAEVRARMLALPGIGPWTVDYIALRALGDPDVFLPTDVGVRNAWRALAPGVDVALAAQEWRPWRSYALMVLWESLNQGVD